MPLLLLQPCRDAAQAELLAMQGAKQDLELGQVVLIDKLQQCQAENEQVVQHMAQLQARITNSTADYIDILQHCGEQIKAAETRASSLQQQLEHLQQELAQAAKEVSALKVPPRSCANSSSLLTVGGHSNHTCCTLHADDTASPPQSRCWHTALLYVCRRNPTPHKQPAWMMQRQCWTTKTGWRRLSRSSMRLLSSVGRSSRSSRHSWTARRQHCRKQSV